MASRCSAVLSACLLVLGLLSPFALGAAEDTKIGEHTIERTIQLRTHSLYAPYIDQDLQNRWWDFGADSYVNTNKHVRLTRAAPSQMGWLWSRLPITASNYVIEVEFKISGESSQLYGDDKFNGLGIFLDTYANSRHSYAFPHITATLGDGNTPYDYGNDGDSSSIGSCSAHFRRTNVATKLKVTYIKDKVLDVKVQSKAWDDWSDCFRVENITLPNAPFIGFSAMTGEVFDAHDIISVTSSSAITTSPSKSSKKSKSKSIFSGGSSSSSSEDEDDESSLFATIFKVLLFVGVCGGGYYGYVNYYQKRNSFGGGNFGGMGMGGMGGPGGMRGYGGPGGMYTNAKRF